MMIHAGFNTALTRLHWGMQIAVCTLVIRVQNVQKGDLMVNSNVMQRMLFCSFCVIVLKYIV